MKFSEMSEEQKEKYRQYHRNYYQTHKQQHKARCDKWAKEHPDKVKEIRKKCFKEYYERNKDKLKQRRLELHPRKFVAVVRCRDCKYGEQCNQNLGEFYLCSHDIGTMETSVHKSDWFCADGKRKDEE